jgi:uncharacterized protein with FMN-binding domain
MAKRGSGGRSRRVSNGLVGLSSAAVLAIYGAGYLRTRPAAAKFAHQAERRAPAAAAPAAALVAPSPIAPPATPTPGAAPAIAAPPAPAIAAPPPPAIAAPPAPAMSAPPFLASQTRARRAAALNSTPVVATVPQPRKNPGAPGPASSVPPVQPAAPAPEPASREETPPATAAPPEPPVAPPPAAPPAPAAAPLKDGTFLGWGSSRHGDIQASVEVQGGRIVSATIAQCLTRYSCSWIAPLPPQVVARQSANVDYVSGATQSTNAFYDAVVDALSKAK